MTAHAREAYRTALQFERIVLRILHGTKAIHSQKADELAEYTNQMIRCLRSSNPRVGTRKGIAQTIQAAVWMVEVLIVLEELKETREELPLVLTAIEILERMEDALRTEGSLPPALD